MSAESRLAPCPRQSISTRFRAGRSTSISCASVSTPRSPSRCPCGSTMKKPRRASSAAACSTSSSTSSSSSATPRAHFARRAGNRRRDPHQPGQASRRRDPGDRRPRLHGRDRRCSIRDALRRRRGSRACRRRGSRVRTGRRGLRRGRSRRRRRIELLPSRLREGLGEGMSNLRGNSTAPPLRRVAARPLPRAGGVDANLGRPGQPRR